MNHTIIILLALIGLAAHFLKKLREAKMAGTQISIRQYYLANPYSSLLSIVFCIGGLVMLWDSVELTKVTAFTLGYMSDSVVAAVMQRHGYADQS